MKHSTQSKIRSKYLLFLGLFLAFYSNTLMAQSAQGIALNWNVEVGCQSYYTDPKRKDVFLEDITDGNCLRVCEGYVVTYSLTGPLGSNPATVWSSAGGTINSQSNTSCTVIWGDAGAGSLTFVLNLPTGVVTKTLCFEKIIKPFAFFNLAPVDTKQLSACINQTLNFVNYSTPNNGTNLISYFWDFGDGSYSTAFNPSHMYAEEGVYYITLTVTNACNCSASYRKVIKVFEKGFNISCPTVVCENQQGIYTLPEAVGELCHENYNWTLTSGHIDSVNPDTGAATVTWNHIDQSGFGYLTFNPSKCELSCLLPTTIKVPVIQTIGTIVGDVNVCLEDQNIYKLPQWPTTDFHWEVVDNVDNSLAILISSDQRNEVVVQPLVTGTITLRCTYFNTLLGCGGTATLVINVSKPIGFVGDFVICTNTTGNYNSGSVLTNWTLKDNYGTVIGSAENTANFSFPFATAGGYTLSVGTSGTCPAQVKNITVVLAPTSPLASSLLGDLLVCPNAPYLYSMPNNPTSQYHWSITNGSINGVVSGSAIGNQITASFTGVSPAQLVVYKESITPIVCPSLSTTIPVTIRTINAEIAGNASVCGNSNAGYQANTTGATSLYTEGETYTWSISPVNLGSVTTGQNTNLVNILWNNVNVATTATITLVITKCTLTTTITKTVQLTPTPVIDITATPTTTCSGSPIIFNIVSTNGVPITSGTVTWNFGSGNVSGSLSQQNIFSNISGANIGKNVTAFVTNANGCAGITNTANVNVTILPGPPATASLSTSFNTFCTATEISATLTVSSAKTGGITIKWRKNNSFLLGEDQPTLNVTPAMGFGGYSFIATNSAGCQTISNVIMINQFCGAEPSSYTGSHDITNTSTQACNVLNLVGTASGTPQSESWTIFGPPNVNLINYTGSTYTATAAGEFHTFYVGSYLNANNELCSYAAEERVIVPYIPDLAYAAVCNGNNDFTVTLTDKTSYFAPVTNVNVTYSYRQGTGAWITITGNTVTLPAPPPNYEFKIEVTGNYLGNPQPLCEKIIPVSLAVVPAQSISFVNPIPCHDTAVAFSVDGQIGDSYLWTFEPGAQNTLASPKRVFSSPWGVKVVTVKITNKYGCERTLSTTTTIGLPTTVNILSPCFNGNVSSPLTTVCMGSSVTLNYVAGAGNCPVATYTWMNGQNAIVGAPNAATITVNTPGFYWVNVKSSLNCSYDTPTRITPTFKSPPSIKLNGPAATCQGESVVVKATTTATVIRWVIDLVAQSAYNNQTTITLNGLSLGSHTVTATVYSGPVGAATTCWASATQTVVIVAAPDEPVISQEIFCVGQNPEMPYYHVNLTATSNVSGVFNWSNGVSGSSITVTDGGPYQVRVTSGGCSSKAQVDVPKNLEDYIWIFPTGCIDACVRKDGGTPLLIGPNLPLTFWDWQYNENTAQYGHDSFPTPFPLTESGTYNLALTQGECTLQSPPLNYTVQRCDKCAINSILVVDVKPEEYKYCSYKVAFGIESSATFPATVTVPNNEVVINPAALTILGGTNTYDFTVFPMSGFAGGSVNFQVNGFLENGQPCITEFTVNIPSCNENTIGKTSATTAVAVPVKVVLLPNPAKEQVSVHYNGLPNDAVLELYDLTGRNLAAYSINSSDGDLIVPTTAYPSGIYLVVVRAATGLISQQKLVIE